MKRPVLIATSNPGKVRDFAGAAAPHGIEVQGLPRFASLPAIEETGVTFDENARAKAEHYSRFAPGELVLADDSGLEVDALRGAPGVYSARFAFIGAPSVPPQAEADRVNNDLLLAALAHVADGERGARFVCVLAAARDGRTVATFRGEVAGRILCGPRGSGGFGYDPLFFYPALGKTLAELTAEAKAGVSHRGAAFRSFLEWSDREGENKR